MLRGEDWQEGQQFCYAGCGLLPFLPKGSIP